MPIRIYDDSSSEFAYSGTWSRTGTWASSDGQRGTISVTSEQGASVSFTFPIPAVAFRIYGLKSSRGTYYGVCVDCDPSNPQYTFVTNYNATDNGTNPPVYFYHISWPTAGIHKVTLVNLSDRRGIPAGNSVLALDRFELDVPVGIADPVSQSPSSAAPSSVTQTPTSLSASGGGGNANSPPVITTIVSQNGGVITQVVTQSVAGASGGSRPAANPPITTSPSAGVQNSASQTALPSPSPSAMSGDKPLGAAVNDTGHSSKSMPLGGIIGGIVGGLAVIALVIFLFFWLKKRKKAMSPATGVTPLEVPEMRTTAPDLGNSEQVLVNDYNFGSEKGNRHHFEQSYSSYPSGSNPRTNSAASNAALLNPAPVSPPASTLSYTQSQHPSEPLYNENSSTREVRRVRELDAGPVPRDLQDEDNVETLPPDYGQVFSNHNHSAGPMSQSELNRTSSSGATTATPSTDMTNGFAPSATESSQPLRPVRRT